MINFGLKLLSPKKKVLTSHRASTSLPLILQNPDSLTQKLRAAAKKSFSVQVISEEMTLVGPLAHPLLNLSHKQFAWCRQVTLNVDDAAWIEAKTIIPLLTLQGRGRQLLYIKNQALGDTLFSDPCLKRSVFEIDSQTRRSIFIFHGQPLQISETFLPKSLDYFWTLPEDESF
jgi:chorismate--pyruvate lyase